MVTAVLLMCSISFRAWDDKALLHIAATDDAEQPYDMFEQFPAACDFIGKLHNWLNLLSAPDTHYNGYYNQNDHGVNTIISAIWRTVTVHFTGKWQLQNSQC